MFYDFDFYPTSYYATTPSYCTTYSPGYYLGDRYTHSYRNYTPWEQRYSLGYPSFYNYCTPSAYLPSYRHSCNYLYSIPNYSSRPIYTSVAPSKMLSPPIFPEAEMHSFTYGTKFDSMKEDIRSATAKLQEIRRPRASSEPRFARPTECASLYDSDIDYYRFQKGLFDSIRKRSVEPKCRSIRMR